LPLPPFFEAAGFLPLAPLLPLPEVEPGVDLLLIASPVVAGVWVDAGRSPVREIGSR
jgi:hypothetical protein